MILKGGGKAPCAVTISRARCKPSLGIRGAARNAGRSGDSASAKQMCARRLSDAVGT
jgi:hypothetical protein